LPDQFERPGNYWKRLLLGSLCLIVIAAGATSVAGWNEIDRITEAFEQGKQLKLTRYLEDAESGQPQTIMLIGSDKRAASAIGGSGGARSDTIMLVRLDPSERATALLSLPRDLKVRIPGYGTDKINAAYSYGGPKLTLRTVTKVTGIDVNHVVNVDFKGFREAVNALACPYIDIDRRYFNDNSGYEPDYATIDIKPGYQKLCGQDALDYVRYRHEDTDIVRAARQQEFLRQLKQQIGLTKLFERRDDLLDIFGKYTESDIRGRANVLRLLKLALASAQHPIREIHFKGSIGVSYVTASSAVMRDLREDFLGLKATPGPRGHLKPEGKKKKKKEPVSGLENAEVAGKDQALQLAAMGLKMRKLPAFYPKLRTYGSLYAGPPRYYKIPVGPRGERTWYPAYRMVIKKGLIGEYYGIQGTTWDDPPALRDASETREVGGREYELHFDGDRLRMVAWRTDKGVYWLQNTLLQTLTEQQMMAIATSMRTM
jgi:polyisoprenyl-teichoic acid--peptidoglycan teichoic acid transferase